MQHFDKCIYISSMYVCSLSGPGTTLKVRDVSRGGGVSKERPYDVSRGQNRFVTLPLVQTQNELSTRTM